MAEPLLRAVTLNPDIIFLQKNAGRLFQQYPPKTIELRKDGLAHDRYRRTGANTRIAAWLGVLGVGLGAVGAVLGGCSVWLALPR
jgi:hypothetical protein